MAPLRRRHPMRHVRNGRHRKSGAHISTWVGRQLIAPDRVMVKLRWQVNTLWADGMALPTLLRVYQLNSCFKPNVAGTALSSLEPAGWAYWFSFYQFSTVLAAKIKLRWINGSATVQGYDIATCPSINPSLPVGTQLPLQPRSRTIMLGNANGNRSVQTISQYVSTKEIYGISDSPFDTANKNFSETSSTLAPAANAVNLFVQIGTIGTATTVDKLSCYVTCTAYVQYDTLVGVNA